jgi:glycosyltransferase involved in cell wall biosynthesis
VIVKSPTRVSHRPSTAASGKDADNELISSATICLVGPGWRFTSGISYYTCRLANALANYQCVSVIQMRQLLPRRLYPGRRRVGEPAARMTYPPNVQIYDGVNWWWGLSVIRALSFMNSLRPKVLVFQWWTATVLHSYLLLAVTGRLLGARVVIELHEIQDTGEGRISLVRWYGRWGLGLLLRLSHGCIVHSSADQEALKADYNLKNLRLAITPHGPFDQYNRYIDTPSADEAGIAAVTSAPRPAVHNLLFFGTIRPYKGLEDLLNVFNDLTAEEASGMWLTVVGETWENCTEPARIIAESPHRERITFVNYYVPDEVVRAAFDHADIVVLPYHRSSSSGPLHVAMSWGLPVVLSRVGGLEEAVTDYGGAVFVPPGDTVALKAALVDARNMVGKKFSDPRSWTESIRALFSAANINTDVLNSEKMRL